MKRTSLALIGLAALLVQSTSAQVLFTTTNDFAWGPANGLVPTPVTSMDSDGSTVNGLANSTAPGVAGTGGALAIQWTAPAGNFNFGPFSQYVNSNAVAALEQPGKVLTFDYTTPTNTTGGYFNAPGIVVNCQGRFDQLQNPTFTTSLGGGWTRATFNWTAEAALLATQQVANGGTFAYFGIGIIWNSSYAPNTPFYVDNFMLSTPPPAPVTLFTTTNDFTGWTTETGFSNVGPTNFDLDGGKTNGLGNLTAPGSLGATGSLNIAWSSGTFGVATYSPNENTNAAFLAKLLQPSTFTFDYTTPAVGSGSYFQLGIAVDCQGRFDQIFPSTAAAVSNGITRASIDWTSEAQALVAQQATNGGGFDHFRIGIIWNSNYTPPANTPFQVDNFAVTALPPIPHVVSAGSTITSQSCAPTNNVIDPGETVTVSFGLQNSGTADASNVVVTLLATGGVSAPSGAQSYGTLVAGGSVVTQPFTFTANGTCGSTLTATLQIQTNSVIVGTVPFSYTLGIAGVGATNTYSSGGVSVPIPDATSFTSFGSITNQITVSDTGVVAHVSVRIRINHTYDGDLKIDLVHPDGTTNNLVLNDPTNAGQNFGSGATDCTGTFTVFDDSGAPPISGASGTAPYTGTFQPQQALSGLIGKPTQGTWNLLVTDTGPGDTGTLYCWQLQISAQSFTCCSGPVDPFTTWQNQYFTSGELANPAFSGPGADPFGKGMSNTNQFLAGFNPTNAAAYVHITSISKTNSGTDVRVDYLGASGDSSRSPALLSRTNVLEFTAGTGNGSYSNNFASTGQTNILSGGIGLGTLANMVDPGGATNKPSRYYRVRVLVP